MSGVKNKFGSVTKTMQRKPKVVKPCDSPAVVVHEEVSENSSVSRANPDPEGPSVIAAVCLNLTPDSPDARHLNKALDMLEPSRVDSSVEFPSDSSNSSVNYRLIQALDCVWWKQLSLSPSLAGMKIGRGMIHRLEEDHILGPETNKWREDLGETFKFHKVESNPVSYTHLTLPTNREV